MSYFSSRSRAYSKATKEELALLQFHLSKKSTDELNIILQTAANTSSEVAHILMWVISELYTEGQAHQKFTQAFSFDPQRHCRTPDTSEDSEMSGTDSSSCTISTHSRSMLAGARFYPTESFALNNSPVRPGKQKFLADRSDDNSCWMQSFNKKRRSLENSPRAKRPAFEMYSTDPEQKHRCVNCSRLVDGHEWENLHGCIHHPGYLTSTDVWSCCQLQSLVRGCLVAKHSEVNLRASTTTLLPTPALPT